MRRREIMAGGLLAAGSLAFPRRTFAAPPAPAELLNVSYDASRELYRDINTAFVKAWKAQTGQDISIQQNHGGSGKQAQAVIDGLQADIVTLGAAYDIDRIAAAAGSIGADWQNRLPFGATPYVSTVVFLVRKGNPKAIVDWGDLVRPGVEIVTPNPKTSSGGRWNYLAAWAYGQRTSGTAVGAQDYMTKLFANVPVLDSSARGATTSFVQRGQGDVLIAWENEAATARATPGQEGYELVMPSVSIQAEPPVALIDRVVDKRGTRAIAEAYLRFLYTREGQTIIAENYYRPRDREILARFQARFPPVPLITVDRNFGGWPRVQAAHFADGAAFDQAFEASRH